MIIMTNILKFVSLGYKRYQTILSECNYRLTQSTGTIQT